jgi:hypothetical protein
MCINEPLDNNWPLFGAIWCRQAVPSGMASGYPVLAARISGDGR